MDDLSTSILQFVAISLLIYLVVFLISRELVCWYWKINEIVRLLKSIDRKMEAINLSSGSETVTFSERRWFYEFMGVD